ncbi:MAG: alpha-galactosidase [Anaerolineales bacterium]|nr:alpha-galactosidase [Anaerolineales bacterium]
MNMSLQIGDMQFSLTADKARPVSGGMILSGANVSLQLPFQPKRYYRHGWQSWSPTGWIEADRPLASLHPAILHPQQMDPMYALEEKPNGAWLGAVEAPDGNVILLGALGLESRVRLEGQSLAGWYEVGRNSISSYDWFLANGAEQIVFAQYATLLGERLGEKGAAKQLRVWCSWYSLYTNIREEQLLHVLNDLGDLPFDVFQIDDGWQKAIGDWEANEKFPSGMEYLAARIHATGRTPGLWLAPLLVVPSSSIFRQHPDWLLHDEKGGLVSAGFNWNEPLYALDTTHPAALDWLAALMKKVRAWGYDYLKLDFLYAGALPGKRHKDMPREAAYRHGLKVMREVMGEAYFLTCGAPILPSLGLCDGMRIGPDVAAYWDSNRDSRLLNNLAAPGVRNALRTTLHRLWLMPLVHADPDVVYFRTRQNKLSPEQMQLLQDLAAITGFKATSDLPAWLTPAERAALAGFLKAEPPIQQTGRYTFEIGGRRVDFTPAMPLPQPLDALEKIHSALLCWLANRPRVIKAFDRFSRWMLARSLQDIAG